ncbi:oxidoreductase [Pilimelia terevasa]|uniref:Oxidoreductase n=1 Tax=Pilimelia terevasa TaxID=53372 RepID=A0A8J3BRS6_9ACTN|nr:oxidoreductase [Pilimelia terevasa]GGK41407.1 oxidoreductase [Pilimelia terevasa]
MRRALTFATVLSLATVLTLATPPALAAAPALAAPLADATAPGSAVPAATRQAGAAPAWNPRPTGVDSRLRGLAPVDDAVAWAAGSKGAVLRTTDGGAHWVLLPIPGAEAMDFRDVVAWDAQRALVLSVGDGGSSRIYRTRDGGRTWTEGFRNADPKAFYDCMSFFDTRHGLALSDAVDGRFRIIATDNGGDSWQVLPTDGMPAAQDGESAFAASGTCLVAQRGGQAAWFATTGKPFSRVFRTADRGLTWSVTDSPVPGGGTSGIYTLAMRDWWRGVALGGDYTRPTEAPQHAALTGDSGRGWQPAGRAPGEYRSGAAWVGRSETVLAVGPTGSDVSADGGRTWTRFDTGSYDAVECTAAGACWATGEQGRAATLAR